jgi:hypothetical protein
VLAARAKAGLAARQRRLRRDELTIRKFRYVPLEIETARNGKQTRREIRFN